MSIKISRFCICALLLTTGPSYASDDLRELDRDRDSKFSTILKRIEKAEAGIDNCEAKDVVIVLGPSQAGKSTTINSLLGGELQYDKKVKGFVLKNPNERFAKMGGVGGNSCTEEPALYTKPGHSFAFLDTRGFFDVRFDEDTDIVASILTEMAVKKARSVRIMVLATMNDLKQGVVGFRPLGKTLSKIVVGQKVPMLFLFNRYTPHPQEWQDFYSQSLADQQSTIMTDIHESIGNLVAGEATTISELGERISNKFGKMWKGLNFFSSENDSSFDEEIARDQEFQGAMGDTSYVNTLQYNVNLNNIEYIDPTKSESVSSVLHALEILDPINVQSLVFNGYNTARVQFDEAFAQAVSPMLLLMKAKAKASKYCLSVLGDLEEEASACLNFHKAVAGKFVNNEVNTNNREAIEKLEIIEAAYTTRQEDIEARKKQLKKRQKVASKRINDLNSEILTLNAGDPILYWTDKWKNECDWLTWWRDHRCTYPYNTPILQWKECLQPCTTMHSIVRIDSPYLDIWYTSDLAYNCEGKVEVYVSPKDDPSTQALVKVKQADIATLESEITNLGESLKREDSKVINNLQDKIASKIRLFADQVDKLRKSIVARRNIDHIFIKQFDQLQTYEKIATKLESNKPVIKEFKELFPLFDKGCDLYLLLDEEMPEQLDPNYTPLIIKMQQNTYDLVVNTLGGVKRISNPGGIHINDLTHFFQEPYAQKKQFLEWKHPIIQHITLKEGHIPDKILQNEQKELGSRFTDEMFGHYLLDPVQLQCAANGHGRSYERRNIAQHLQSRGTCPDCRENTSRFIPISVLGTEIGDIIDGIYSDTQSAAQMLKGCNLGLMSIDDLRPTAKLKL